MTLKPERVIASQYPFTVPWLSRPDFEMRFETAVTFLVGENGSGKSTLLEALAWRLGFNAQGGNKDQSFAEEADARVLGGAPPRQLAFLAILHRLCEAKIAQFILATHAPILMTLPNATILSLDGPALRRVEYWETEHFQVTKDFLNAPQRYYRHLLDEGAGGASD